MLVAPAESDTLDLDRHAVRNIGFDDFCRERHRAEILDFVFIEHLIFWNKYRPFAGAVLRSGVIEE